MMILRDTVSLIARLLLAVVLIVGSTPMAPVIADDHGGMAQVSAAVTDHNCCDPEPSEGDRACALACTQAPCGSTVIPVSVDWPVNAVVCASWTAAAASLLVGIAIDPATPPPRA